MTDFMIKVMPQCEELFLECHWIGKIFDCCELFQLQRSEEGFCYSFNSLTSVNNQHCMLTSEDLTNLRTHRYASSGITDECMLRRNSGAGSSTGLVVYVKKFDDTQRIPNANNVTGVQGVRVISFGGIAGLFLGFSILTLVELAYWSVKLIHYNISDRKNKRVHPTEKNLFHSNTSSSSMFQTQDDLDRYPTLPFVY
ncbi:uncharacterized protein LOC113467262 [Diaphorina citri]|uniref:Uncharacterized protein LOC113467262 n=1 Tax=Diaphorina citri TaxID=121845 RepID=A0A3Q0ISA1_DIACI|nr:uncharacterized protein LOC113467262 [Diaphorina citri]